VTRLLDMFGSPLARLRGEPLRDAITASEGRTVMAEVVAGAPPLLAGTSNPELVAAFGADLVCLNMIDPRATGVVVEGLGGVDPHPAGFAGLADLLGRPVGLNLEPEIDSVPEAFRASEQNAQRAFEHGAAFVVITANPGRGATLADLVKAVEVVRAVAPDLLCLAGKMHRAGSDERIDETAAFGLTDAGAQGVLVPIPGTVPGIDESIARDMAAAAQDGGALAMGTIGTSQEGAEVATMQTLALTAKRVGFDLHHIGDAGYAGIAAPENIYGYSVALRGRRHTWNRMARSARASWRGS
jgi:hypothetical protein